MRQRRLAALHRIRRKPSVVVDAGGHWRYIRQSGGPNQRRRQTAPLSCSRSLACEPSGAAFSPFSTRNRRDFEDIPGLDLVLYQLPIRTSTGDR